MDFCSYFINQQGLFGRYPTQDEVIALGQRGITLFVDLTAFNEGLTEYKCSVEKIHYYINDCRVPSDQTTFRRLIHQLVDQLRAGRRMYIHCRGGHGRSGLVVACILKLYHHWESEMALWMTNEYHNARLRMEPKWRAMGAPQTRDQKEFVRRF